jgi:hypothetical protein
MVAGKRQWDYVREETATVIMVFTSSLMKTPSGLLAIILQIGLPVIHQALAYFLHLICLIIVYLF